jgi:Bcr/CflA subfamily drug resistance transporter
MNKPVLFKSFYIWLALYYIVVFLSLDMYLPALPTISRELGLTDDMAQYTITLWFLGSASFQLVLGPLSDYYGRKKVFILGIMVFVLSSLVIASSPSYNTILIARFFQGATVCSTMVAGSSTVHSIFSGRRAVQVLAVLSSITILAPSLGPLLGAYVVKYYSWQCIFFILAFCGSVGLFVHAVIMPDTKDENANLNIKLIFSAYADILMNKQFLLFVLANSLLISVFFMWIVESPFIIIKSLNLGELYFGYVQMPIFGAFILGGQITRYFSEKHDVSKIVCSGMLLSLLGGVFFMLFAWLEFNILFCVAAMTLMSVGVSMTCGPLNRYAILASDGPIGSKVALTSAATSLFGVVASFVVTMVNDMSFFNIAVPILVAVVLANIIFFVADVPDID